jgi:hypothetical protein
MRVDFNLLLPELVIWLVAKKSHQCQGKPCNE